MTEETTPDQDNTPLDDFWNVFAGLVQDVRRCIKVFEDGKVTDKAELLFWDRALARSTFALIEGTPYSMAWLAYSYVHFFKVETLSALEIEELENAYDFDDPIEPKMEIDRSHLLNKIQWAFDVFARVHAVEGYPLTELTEWVLIKEILSYKEGLAHPRTPEALILYEENREVLIEGAVWFIKRVPDLLKKCRDGMEAYGHVRNAAGDPWDTDINDFIM